MFVFELLEEIRLELRVGAHRFDDLLSLSMRRGFDQIRQLCGVEAGELRVRHPEPHGRDVPREWLDRGPVEEFAGRDALREGVREEPADEAAEADVDADDAVPPVEPDKLDLVGADEAGAVDVDQLAVEHVFTEQHFAGASPKVLQVDALLAQHDAALGDLGD